MLQLVSMVKLSDCHHIECFASVLFCILGLRKLTISESIDR